MIRGQLDVINDTDNSQTLADFVRVDGGGLFTHTLDMLGFSYLWLETLVPEIRAVESPGPPANQLLFLDCDATVGFFPGLTCDEIADFRRAIPWHTHFVNAEGETGFGGLVPVARGPDLPGGLPGNVVILAGPAMPGTCTD